MANKLLTAIVVLAALLVLTVWQFNARESEDTRAPEVTVKLPKLKKDDIDELSVSQADKPSLALKKTDKTWNLVEPLKSLADQTAVDGSLAKLEELEVLGVAATKPENHATLEVDDKKALHVVAKQGGKVLADLMIGTYRGGNTMVREQGAVNVATVKGSIRYAFDKETKDWRDRVVLELNTETVKTVKFENPKGTFEFVKEGTEWKQAPLAKGQKPLADFDGGKVLSLVGTASAMRCQDFAAAEVTQDAAGVGEKPDGLVTLTTSGDAGEQQFVLHAGHKLPDGNYYMRREGKDPIFIVSDFSGSRMIPGPDSFAKDKEAAKAPGGNVPVHPEGMMMAPGGGSNPAIEKLLREHPELAGKIQAH